MVGVSERYDAELLLAAQRRDVDAFAELYDRHARAVLKYAWGYLGDRGTAEDILQDTFATAWERRGSAGKPDESALPWLLSICRNHLRNFTRKRGRHKEHPLRDLLDTVPAEPQGDELGWMAFELAKLSQLDQAICQLVLVEGYSYREAAEALNSTAGAVAKRLERARAQLREAMTKNE